MPPLDLNPGDATVQFFMPSLMKAGSRFFTRLSNDMLSAFAHEKIAVDSRGASRPTDMRRWMQTSCLHGQTGSGVKLKLYQAKTMHIYRGNWGKVSTLTFFL